MPPAALLVGTLAGSVLSGIISGGGPSAPPFLSGPAIPTRSSAEVEEARRTQVEAASKRKGIRSTILSGQTGADEPAVRTQTILG